MSLFELWAHGYYIDILNQNRFKVQNWALNPKPMGRNCSSCIWTVKHLTLISVFILSSVFILRWSVCSRMQFLSCSYLISLKYREVHIWCLFPNEIRESNLSLYKGIISHEERTHLMDTMKHKAKEYLLTRVLARTLLAKCMELKMRKLLISIEFDCTFSQTLLHAARLLFVMQMQVNLLILVL